MVIAANVHEPDHEDGLPLISAGTMLIDSYIERLKSREITWVYTEIPPEMVGAPGEHLDVEHIKKDIRYEGKLNVVGFVAEGVSVDARERLSITGDIGKGASITCREGSLVLRGSALGDKGAPVRITVGQNVILDNARHSEIKSGGEVKITGSISGSSLIARGEVHIEGAASSSKLYSQDVMRIASTDAEDLPLALTVKPLRSQELLQELLRIDATITGLGEEKQRLSNIIELIKKLGASIADLPQEKKVALATDVKRYKEIDQEIAQGEERKKQIMLENERLLAMPWVLIHGTIAQGTKITILNSTLELKQAVAHKAFSVRNFKIHVEEFSA